MIICNIFIDGDGAGSISIICGTAKCRRGCCGRPAWVPVGVELAVVGVIVGYLAIGEGGIFYEVKAECGKRNAFAQVGDHHGIGGVEAETKLLEESVDGVERALLPRPVEDYVASVADDEITTVAQRVDYGLVALLHLRGQSDMDGMVGSFAADGFAAALLQEDLQLFGGMALGVGALDAYRTLCLKGGKRKKRKVESHADAYQHNNFPLSAFSFHLSFMPEEQATGL